MFEQRMVLFLFCMGLLSFIAYIAESRSDEGIQEEETPSPHIEILDPEMTAIVAADAVFEKIASGLRFTEGPVWLSDRDALIFSDIPANRLYVWSEEKGLEIFREPSQNANGNTLDPEGRLVTCEHGSRRVTRTEEDGTITVLAATCRGRRFNSPNDVVASRDGRQFLFCYDRRQPVNFYHFPRHRLEGAASFGQPLIDFP